mgnify:CR=1 FL=1
MILILTGFISGIISGMGIGGGTVLIPALTILKNSTSYKLNLLYTNCHNCSYYSRKRKQYRKKSP